MKKLILLFLLLLTGCSSLRQVDKEPQPAVIIQPHPGEDGTVRGFKYEPEETK